MKMPSIVEINVQNKDDGKDGDGKYCAIVMGWHETSKAWYNTGIVVREESPVQAFNKAIARATERGWWK